MAIHDIVRSDSLGDELGTAELGDKRLSRRLSALVNDLSENPAASFPSTFDDAALEGTYRFFGNERVTPERILAPHVRATVARSAQHETVLVAHDTTQFNLGLFPREGLGRVGRGASYGFYGHFALVVTADASRQPLGVIGLHTVFRREKSKKLKHGKNQDNPTNEARRWITLVEETHEVLGRAASAIHVMDREGDNYALFSRMVELGARFVVRLARDRNLLADPPDSKRKVTEVLAGTPVLAEREVPLSARRRQEMPTPRRRNPPRSARVARLQLRAGTVTIPRPVTSSKSPHETLTLNLVHVMEVEAPDGAEPVEWWLWTTDPVATERQVLGVVDAYRGRWVIEEYFKALKTGCAYENRQLESSHALLNALAVFAPVAWRLLLLRSLGREGAHAPASTALSDVQLRCLRIAYKKRRKKDLPAELTVRDAMLAVAAVGGHLTNNGEPGWQVLGRGFDKLLVIEEGYWMAIEARGEM